MKYFLHDSSAFQDEKVTELFMAHGYEGLGLFYTILEKLAHQEKPIKTLVLKKQLSVGKKLDKCWQFLESIGLICSNNGETFNDNLLKFSEKYQISKEKTRERVAKFRENQALEENVTRYSRVSNAPKVKESKGKESKSTPSSEGGAPLKKNELVFPDWATPLFHQHWSEWLTFRQGKRDKLKPASIQKMLDKLAGFDEGFCLLLFDKAISNGYTGLIFDDTPAKYEIYKSNQSKPYDPLNGTASPNGRQFGLVDHEKRAAAMELLKSIGL